MWDSSTKSLYLFNNLYAFFTVLSKSILSNQITYHRKMQKWRFEPLQSLKHFCSAIIKN
nr:MAG TPA: hypothetical protein [Caudoviricetes sp.]